MSSTSERLQDFVNFCDQHIRGDEKGEAQTFLDRFFRAFGHEGALEAGAEYEQRIKKGSKTGKTGFADLVWKPRVLIEMKKRGEKLGKHYSQAFDYWQRAVPNRPRYVMLCNFDEFWIYDFDTQIDTPVDTITLEQLPQQVETFAFMEKVNREPVFRNNQVEVTETAARQMGELLVELKKRGIDTLVAQRFVLQCVLAMFAEDRKLLPHSIFLRCVKDCLESGESSYDVLRGLFQAMNTPGMTPVGRFQGVDYFNGGLFAEIHPLELTKEELKFLEVSAIEDWSMVRPAIFGNVFESAIDEKERHAHGIHYTAEADIMKIVRPTISRYWEERIEAAGTIGELEKLQLELQAYRVLDPACGSGNFLYIAYQELKQIEQMLLEKIAERRRSPREQMQMGFITPNQFFGIDNNPFAVELARVTLMIARKVAIDRLGLFEPALPLDTLDKNIVCADALFTEWPKADAIIGNPPFLGRSRMKTDLGDEYVEKVCEVFPEVKDKVDLCIYWFRLAHENIEGLERAGLVGTNSISQGLARTASLDYLLRHEGVIHEAISTQPWSGEAKVHVSIVNWSKSDSKELYLDNKIVSQINSSFESRINIAGVSSRLKSNLNLCFKGVEPRGKHFIIDSEEASKWLSIEPKNKVVVKPFIDARSLTASPNFEPQRWIIDFDNLPLEEASNYFMPFSHVRKYVKPQRGKVKDEWAILNWWKYWRIRSDMRKALKDVNFYFATPRHSKWFIFCPASCNFLLGDSTAVVATNDFYILGILTSEHHRLWISAQCSIAIRGDSWSRASIITEETKALILRGPEQC